MSIQYTIPLKDYIPPSSYCYLKISFYPFIIIDKNNNEIIYINNINIYLEFIDYLDINEYNKYKNNKDVSIKLKKHEKIINNYENKFNRFILLFLNKDNNKYVSKCGKYIRYIPIIKNPIILSNNNNFISNHPNIIIDCENEINRITDLIKEIHMKLYDLNNINIKNKHNKNIITDSDFNSNKHVFSFILFNSDQLENINFINEINLELEKIFDTNIYNILFNNNKKEILLLYSNILFSLFNYIGLLKNNLDIIKENIHNEIHLYIENTYKLINNSKIKYYNNINKIKEEFIELDGIFNEIYIIPSNNLQIYERRKDKFYKANNILICKSINKNEWNIFFKDTDNNKISKSDMYKIKNFYNFYNIISYIHNIK